MPPTSSPAPAERWQTQCCIAGGGPAGMMAGYLLARAGVDVVVLEKHADFLRDFRGDTIHPSTLEVMHELGILDELLQRPHQRAHELRGQVGDEEVTLADFGHLRTHCRFIAFMPQWEFLDFLAEQARRYPTFRLRMLAQANELVEERGQIAGVRAMTPQGPLEVRAALTIAADGRQSTLRALAGLKVHELGAPMDVLWMRLSRRGDDPGVPLGRFGGGRILVLIYRGDYWQCGFVIPKGQGDEFRRRGLPALRDEIARVAPFLQDRLGELRSWDDVKLLTVKVDRLERWYRPGLLCIGDAAHAMSPVAGVGINLAIQDAVATSNLLAAALRDGRLTVRHLAQVQRRRATPTRLTQAMQLAIQSFVIRPALGEAGRARAPRLVRLFQRWPALRRIPAHLVGVGFRPEHAQP